MSDEDLVPLAADGDAGAFAALYDRHSRAAYSLAYRMTGERHAAEDLAQEAFLRAWPEAVQLRARVTKAGHLDHYLLTQAQQRAGGQPEDQGPLRCDGSGPRVTGRRRHPDRQGAA